MYRVIIVDDEEIIRNGIQRAVDWQELGYEIAGTFPNGIKALEFLHRNKAEVVMTDIRMPLMSGLELAKAVQTEYPWIKVILLSGYGDFAYAKEAINCNVFSYILKPSEEEELLDVFGRLKSKLDEERVKSIGFPAGEQYNETGSVSRLVKKAVERIATAYDADITLESLAEYVGVTPEHFSRAFKKEMNINFKEYLTDIRIQAAKKLLREIGLKVYQVAQAVGYHDHRYFSETFKSRTGMTPLEYRDKGGAFDD